MGQLAAVLSVQEPLLRLVSASLNEHLEPIIKIAALETGSANIALLVGQIDSIVAQL